MNTAPNITKYPAGTVKEIVTLSFPLMLMSLSGLLMLFVDRWILSEYSVKAMGAVALAGMFYYIPSCTFTSIALIAEVFVGQFNGRGMQREVGSAVWQMVWFSVMSIPLFWLMAWAMYPLVATGEFAAEGIPYYLWIMLLGAFSPLTFALSSFYIGRGKNMAVILVVVFGNVINIGLDFLLVFGYKDIVPSMGTKGAAIATGIGILIQVLLMLGLFLRPRHREKYGTDNYHFKKELFWKAVKTGAPNGVTMGMAFLAWALFFKIISDEEEAIFSGLVICQNAFILFNFFTEGIGKAVAALCSNYIGASRPDLVPKVVKAASKYIIVISAFLLLPLIFFPEFIADMFLNEDASFAHWEYSIEALRWVLVMFLFDALFIVLYNQLTAAGDTVYMMVASNISLWLVLVIPSYLLINKYNIISGAWSWRLMAMDMMAVCLLAYWRYKSGKWKEKQLIDR